MACEAWRDKLDRYVDGELASADAAALNVHMRSCPDCSADALETVQLKRAVSAAGKRYEPDASFRAKMVKTISAKPRRNASSLWKIVAIPALSVLIASIAVNWYVGRESARRHQLYSELVDLHVAALAGTSPVDVVSSDRHTVKPWFQGRIPFSFNLPDLQGTGFTLLGGRVSYLAQTPGAQLIYQIRKHEVSVFIFQDRGEQTASLPSDLVHELSFNMENWTQNGLRYFVVGDVNAEDIQALSKLLRDAG